MSVTTPERVEEVHVEQQHKRRRSYVWIAVAVVLCLALVAGSVIARHRWVEHNAWQNTIHANGLVGSKVVNLPGRGPLSWTSIGDGTVIAIDRNDQTTVVSPGGVATTTDLLTASAIPGYAPAIASSRRGDIAVALHSIAQPATLDRVGLATMIGKAPVLTSMLSLPEPWRQVWGLAYSPDGTLYALFGNRVVAPAVAGLFRYDPASGWNQLATFMGGCQPCQLGAGRDDAVYINRQPYLMRYTPATGLNESWRDLSVYSSGPFVVEADGTLVFAGIGAARPNIPSEPGIATGDQSFATLLKIAADGTETAWPIIKSNGRFAKPVSVQPGTTPNTYFVLNANAYDRHGHPTYQLTLVTVPTE